MNNPTISIIIPVYNAEKYFMRCVQSLFTQTISNLEFIFVNDCTPDESLDILQLMLELHPHRIPQVKIINHETNQGVSACRNTGLSHATGKYIGWVDSDDWVDDKMFDVLYQKAEEFDSDLVWCDYYFCDNKELRWEIKRQMCQEESIATIKGMLYGSLHGHLWNSIVKRQIYVDNEIQFSPDFNLMEDKDVSIKLRYYAQKFKYLRGPHYCYNKINTNSITHSQANYEKNLADGINSMLSIFSFLESNDKGIDFSEDFVHAKLVFKDYLFLSFTKQGYLNWKQTFPEVNKFFVSYKAIPFRYRCRGWMIIHNWWFVLKVCIVLRNFVK